MLVVHANRHRPDYDPAPAQAWQRKLEEANAKVEAAYAAHPYTDIHEHALDEFEKVMKEMEAAGYYTIYPSHT